MICSKIYKICMNVEMCEMCRSDTHALASHLFTLAATDDAKQVLEDLMKYNKGLSANKRINAD